MGEAPKTPCCICGHDIHDTRCKHPWGDPFDRWPVVILNEVKAGLNKEPLKGS